MALRDRLTSARDRIARGHEKLFRYPGSGSGAQIQVGGFGAYGSLSRLLPGTQTDYARLAGAPWLNGVVLSGINWLSRTWDEAPQVVFRLGADGKDEQVPKHPATPILTQPNSHDDPSTLWFGVLLSLVAAGTGYLYKERNGYKRVIGLQYIPHFMIEPFWPKNGSEHISGFCYRTDGQEILLPREDVALLKWGRDPMNTRKGLSPLAAELRSIYSDNEIVSFHAAILKNMGVPGVVISPKDVQATISAENAEILKLQWADRFMGDNRGMPFAPSAAVDVQKITLTPEELALEKMARLTIPRICGAMGIDPMVLGLPSDTKTYSNYAEAREAVYETLVIPLQGRVDQQLTMQLMPEMVGAREGDRFGRNYSNVRCLQPDMDKLYARLTAAVGGAWLSPNEAREQLHYKPIDGGDELNQKPDPSTEKEEAGEQAKALRMKIAERRRERRSAMENQA
jgi:HK97 family phage portal protein